MVDEKGLDAEYANWTTTGKIRALLAAHAGGDKRLAAEADNILERWILTAANSVNPAALYPPLTLAHPACTKMMIELQDKKLAPNHAGAVQLMKKVLEITTVKAAPGAAALPVCGKTLEWRGFALAATPRMSALVKDHGCTATLRAAMRYEATIGGGQSWGLTRSHADELYEVFGVRLEGFASPFNARFYGKPGASFCSLFPDTDAVFGSRGSFFDTDLLAVKGHAQVNPPFVEALLTAAADKVLAALAIAKTAARDFRVFFLVPAWHDTPAHKKLGRSAYLVARGDLQRNKYLFELPNGETIVARVDCIYFMLASQGVPAGIAEAAKEMFARLNTGAS